MCNTNVEKCAKNYIKLYGSFYEDQIQQFDKSNIDNIQKQIKNVIHYDFHLILTCPHLCNDEVLISNINNEQIVEFWRLSFRTGRYESGTKYKKGKLHSTVYKYVEYCN